MIQHRIRTYASTDRAACLAIFDSDTPTYFRASERADFEGFLDRQRERYFVVEGSDDVVACGGWGWRKENPRVALLCWGLVRRDLHCLGFGIALLTYRLDEIAKGDFDWIEIVTSQHSAPFFSRTGFAEIEVTPDRFAPGLDAHRMRLPVASLR